MLREDGSAALTDFGLAKGAAYTALTRPGQLLGTLDYLAPELLRGDDATPASDILGAPVPLRTPGSHQGGRRFESARLHSAYACSSPARTAGSSEIEEMTCSI
jgi:serine/threonine protein kinase